VSWGGAPVAHGQWGFGGGFPAADGQWRFGGGSPDAVAILRSISKKYTFLGIFWSKFLLKNAFLNG